MLEITKEYLDSIKALIVLKDADKIREASVDLHPADIAITMTRLSLRYSKLWFSYLDKDDSINVLVELEEDIRNEILEDYKPEEIVTKFIDGMDSDDAADIINDLPIDINKEVVTLLNKSKEEDAQDVISLLEYEEDTAGGLMAKELVQVNLNDSVSECIAEIQKQAEEVEKVYSVYVVDDDDNLKGIIPLKKLVLSASNVKIKNIFDEDINFVDVSATGEQVANVMSKYNLVVLPVVDNGGKLVGRITIDDVVDFIREEAEEDYQLMSGITEDVKPSDKIWHLSRARLPWLLLGLVGGVIASKVIGIHESTIQIYPEMAFFIPLITAMAGNAGVQSSAIVVQAIAGHTLGKSTFLSRIVKEFAVSLLNGLICAIILLSYGFIFSESMEITLTISISLLTVIVLASTLGLAIPLILNKFKIDPALATGPFITTSNDLIGLAVYFWIGHLMYSISF